MVEVSCNLVSVLKSSYIVNMKHQIFTGTLFLAMLLSFKICSAQEKRYSFEEVKPDCVCHDFEWNNRGHLELKDISQSIHDLEIRLEERDTIFLRKPNAEGHSVYVDKDEDSPYYAVLKNLDYTKTDKDYVQSVEELQKYKKTDEKKADLGTLPRHWVQLHQYKGKYYVYSPSNRTQLKISLNDSTLITKEMERRVDLLNNIHQVRKFVYQISTTDYKGESRSFRIHLVNESRGIAVFEDLFEKGSHILMASTEWIQRFPLVINYTPNHMEPEFEFDEPDFEGLINPEGK